MTFNPDRSKQTQEIIFSRKFKKATHPPLLFNNNNDSQVNTKKHLGVILDVKFTFEEHLKNAFNKTNKTIGQCVKSVQIRSYFWSVFSCIQSEYRKIRIRNNSVFGHFLRSRTFTEAL